MDFALYCRIQKGSGLVNGRKQLTEDCTRIDVGARGGEELQNGEPFSFPLINNQWPPNNTPLLPVSLSGALY